MIRLVGKIANDKETMAYTLEIEKKNTGAYVYRILGCNEIQRSRGILKRTVLNVPQYVR